MNILEKIKELCDKNNISMHKLEMNLGFSNGSITKAKTLPFDRVVAIAGYFNVPLEYFTTDEEKPETASDEAVKLYSQYLNASPEIRSAIETLLKAQVHDS